MSVPADMSLMDILFDRDDPVLKFVDDRDVFKPEFDVLDMKNDILNDKVENWPSEHDDLLNDILNDDTFNPMEKNTEHVEENICSGMYDWKPVTHDGSGIKEVVVGGSISSTFSDSGLSSDQVSPSYFSNEMEMELSPNEMDDDEEHLSSAMSTISDTSVNQTTSHNIKFEPQDVDFMETNEDEQAVLGILPAEEQNCGRKKYRQVLSVCPVITSNPRSVLLPINTGNGVQTYKIVNATNGRRTLKAVGSLRSGNTMMLKTLRPVGVPVVLKNVKNSVKKIKTRQIKLPKDESDYDEDEEVTVVSDSEDDKTKSQYPRLILSPEEKKLMQKEGVTLPTHYPLTKFEERELKRIRRKIRNKISAQDSRKRKKEYLDGLEDRVKQCTEENLSLVKKIKFLQSQNQSLMNQLKKLQLTLARTTTKTAQPATCLMVIMLSVALIMAPNLRLSQSNDVEISDQDVSVADQSLPPIAGRTRSLLSNANLQEECSSNEEEESRIGAEMHDFLQSRSNSPDLFSDTDTSKLLPSSSTSSRKSSFVSASSEYDSPLHFFADHDYDPPPSKKSRFRFDDHHIDYDYSDSSYESYKKKDYIIPPLDDDWPSEKALKPKQFIIPEVDDDWAPKVSGLMDKIETLTTEVKVNISDAKGTRTVVIQVPKEKK